MRQLLLLAAVAALALLPGCDRLKQSGSNSAPTVPAVVENAAAPLPDVGKMESQQVTASGLGASPGEAMAQALSMALLQVNGATIQTANMSTKYGLDVSLGKDSASLRAQEFVESVKQKSGGVIQSMQVVSLEEPTEKTPGRYKYTINATIAKFKPSADMQKIKVVVGPIRFEQASLPMGDKSVSAAEVATTLRQRISDALVQTGRFAVLDREFSPEVAQELDMISSGQAPSAELAKLSQAASADLVWSARVSNLSYNRHARQLRTSDRELVSYSGGWAMSQKLVNVATRQVMASDSLQGKAPATEATTLNSGVDGAKVLGDMSNELVGQVVASVLRRMFPITVVARDGTNVVLSQGGQAVKEGTRYALVTMGIEMKDPQTGQSLGRTESPCCEMVIDRVTPNLSYGHLDNVRSNLDTLPVGGLQVRGEVKASAVQVTQASATGAAEPKTEPTPAAETSNKPARRVTAVGKKETEGAPVSKPDDKW